MLETLDYTIRIGRTPTFLYFDLYPYLSCCNIVWSSAYVTSLNIILYFQKRALRAIANSDYRAHSLPLFIHLKILDIYKLNSFHIAKFMYFIINVCHTRFYWIYF